MPGPSLPAAVAAVAVTLAVLAPVAASVVPAEPTTGASAPAAARTGADGVERDVARHPSRPAAAVSAPMSPPAAAVPSTRHPTSAPGSADGSPADVQAAEGAGTGGSAVLGSTTRFPADLGPLRAPAGVGAAARSPASPTGPLRPPGRGWQWPMLPAPTVVERFAVGPFRWSPGHRGVDLAPATGVGVGAVVRSAGPGVVRFAGTVAGRPVVSVDHGGGLRTTYEPVDPAVRAGQVVAAGTVLGTLTSTGSHCAPSACLHWGAILDGRYIDPLLLLRPRDPPVLLPLR